VTDLTRSIEWYQQVLGFDIAAQIGRDGFRRTRLRAPNSGLTLSLTAHADQLGERFEEHRPGMDPSRSKSPPPTSTLSSADWRHMVSSTQRPKRPAAERS